MFRFLYLNELLSIFTYELQTVYVYDDLFMPWQSNKEFFQIPLDA